VEAYKTPKKRRSLGGEDGKMEPPVSRMKKFDINIKNGNYVG